MSAKITRRVTFYLEHEEGEFELPFEPVEGTEVVVVQGNEAVVGFLSHDEDPPHPRREYDTVGRIACWHRRYDIGEEKIVGAPGVWLRELSGLEDADATIDEIGRVLNDRYLMLPLCLLDHSGLHLWVGSEEHWSDPGGWDSGAVGWIYCSLETARKELGLPENASWGTEVQDGADPQRTVTLRELVERILQMEVQQYDVYLRGDVYGVIIVEYIRDGDWDCWRDIEEDACWGFFGWEYAKKELREGFRERRAASE